MNRTVLLTNTDGERLFPIREAAKAYGCGFEVLRKWIYKGRPQRGTGKLVKLESEFWLGRVTVSLEAVARFRAAIQAPTEDAEETPAAIRRRTRAAQKAMRVHGVKV